MWVEQNIPLHEARPIVGEYVRIVHTQNTGAAFGLLPERTTLLSVLSVLAVLAIVYYYGSSRTRRPSSRPRSACSWAARSEICWTA